MSSTTKSKQSYNESKGPSFTERCDSYSLLLFSPENKVRLKISDFLTYSPICMRNNKSDVSNLDKEDLSIFDLFILVFIIVNVVILALSTGATFNNNTLSVFDKIDLLFTVIFTIEAILRIIMMGFIFGRKAYLFDGWCFVDFAVVVISWLSFLPGVPAVKEFRLFRILKALKLIRSLTTLSDILSAVAAAVIYFVNAFILSFFILFVVSILGVQLFSGRYRQYCFSSFNNDYMLPITFCSADQYGSLNLPPSLGGFMCPLGFYCGIGQNPGNNLLSFDDVRWSMLTLFQVISRENWSNVMYAMMEACNSWVWLYFVPVMFAYGYLISNLFVAVASMTFANARKETDRRAMIETRQALMIAQAEALKERGEDQQGALDLQMTADGQIVASNAGEIEEVSTVEMSKVASQRRSKNKVSRFLTDNFAKPTTSCIIVVVCFKIITSILFEIVIGLAIVGNATVLAMPYAGCSTAYQDSLDWADAAFCLFFIGEMILKMIALQGPLNYLNYGMNRFDLFLVIVSIPQLVITLGSLSVDVGAIFVLRVFRVMRCFRFFKQLKSLLDIIAQSAIAISNIWMILTITIVAFGILGMQLFSNDVIIFEENRIGFYDFPAAILTLFQIFTREEWVELLWECIRVNNIAGPIFILIFYIFSVYVIMSMFIAVILETFELEEDVKLVKQRNDFIFSKKKSSQDKINRMIADRRERKRKRDAELKRLKMGIGGEQFQLNLLATNSKVKDQILKNKDKEKIEISKTTIHDDDGEVIGVVETPILNKSSTNHAGHKHPDLSTLDPEELERGILPVPAGHLDDPVIIFMAVGDLEVDEDYEMQLHWSRSLLIFEPEWKIRRFCNYLIVHSWFEAIILVIVLLSSLLLALDTPYQPYQLPYMDDVNAISDVFFLAVFTMEFVLKIVALGFFFNPNSYLDDTWNRLDFVVLLLAYCSYFIIGVPNSLGRVFRVCRTLRPLRMIGKSEQVKIVFSSLIQSAWQILNVLLLFGFFLFMFGVIGLNLFMGTFNYCTDFTASGFGDCRGQMLFSASLDSTTFILTPSFQYWVPIAWVSPPYSFDNIGQSVLTLFQVASLEGWVTIMHSGMDSTKVDSQPRINNNPAYALFFVGFICVTSFFVLNLVVGIIVDNYNQISGDGLLTEVQRKWRHVKKFIKNRNFVEPLGPPNNFIRRFCFIITEHPYFEPIVGALIFINCCIMASQFYLEPYYWQQTIRIANIVFIILFIIEIIMRIITFGLVFYIQNGWNLWDFVIVIGGLLTLVIPGSPIQLQNLRAIRLILYTSKISIVKPISILFDSIVAALVALLNVLGLTLIIFFIFAVIGVNFFGNVKLQIALNQYSNFRSFPQSLLTLCRIVTGEKWNWLMYETGLTEPYCTPSDLPYNPVSSNPFSEMYYMNDCGVYWISIVFFILFALVVTFVLMTLFVAILLDSFYHEYNLQESIVNAAVLDRFDRKWISAVRGSRVAGGLPLWRVDSFVTSLGPPLGITADGHSALLRLIRNECILKLQSKHNYKYMDDDNPPPMDYFVDYNTILTVLSYRCVGLESLTYTERVERTKEVIEVLQWRSRQVIAAILAGKKTRRDLTALTGVDYIGLRQKEAEAKRLKALQLITDSKVQHSAQLEDARLKSLTYQPDFRKAAVRLHGTYRKIWGHQSDVLLTKIESKSNLNKDGVDVVDDYDDDDNDETRDGDMKNDAGNSINVEMNHLKSSNTSDSPQESSPRSLPKPTSYQSPPTSSLNPLKSYQQNLSKVNSGHFYSGPGSSASFISTPLNDTNGMYYVPKESPLVSMTSLYRMKAERSSVVGLRHDPNKDNYNTLPGSSSPVSNKVKSSLLTPRDGGKEKEKEKEKETTPIRKPRPPPPSSAPPTTPRKEKPSKVATVPLQSLPKKTRSPSK